GGEALDDVLAEKARAPKNSNRSRNHKLLKTTWLSSMDSKVVGKAGDLFVAPARLRKIFDQELEVPICQAADARTDEIGSHGIHMKWGRVIAITLA
ncbi:MAG: hypothetical protein L0312_31420, partial [Acidobacteria bacterium]|nr:hypothetical protein [Acidobacteriota bacterium]